MARITQRPLTYLTIGLLVGGLIGWNLDFFMPDGRSDDATAEADLAGLGDRDADPAAQAAFFEALKVNATATENHDNFAIATGLIDAGVEGLYFLDYLTGDLRAAVINPKTGKFAAFFTYNISQDFGGAGGGSPKYLMVTGLVDMPRGRAGFQLSSSVLYIADATTGTVAAYIMPWNSSMMASNKPQTGTFQRLDIKQFRTTVVRDQ